GVVGLRHDDAPKFAAKRRAQCSGATHTTAATVARRRASGSRPAIGSSRPPRSSGKVETFARGLSLLDGCDDVLVALLNKLEVGLLVDGELVQEFLILDDETHRHRRPIQALDRAVLNQNLAARCV